MNRLFSVATCGVWMLLTAVDLEHAVAQREPSSLAGVAEVRAIGTVLTDMPRSPIDSADLQAKVELRLRRMGIRVVPSQLGLPVVEVTLSTAGTGSNVATAIFTSVRVLQLGQLRRSVADTGFVGLFATWETDRIAISGGAAATATADKLLSRVLDDFENAWRQANPR